MNGRWAYRIGCITLCCWLAARPAPVAAAERDTSNEVDRADEAPFALVEIARGIYLHPGITVPFGDPRQDDVANLGFIVGERCVAVVDTGGALRVGRALHKSIRAVTALPICYVINTHVHPDHTLGNAAFVGEAPRFVGHAGLPRAFAHNRAFFLRHYAQALENRGADALVVPDLLVEDTLVLDLGGRELRLTAHPPAHTDHDLSVQDLETGTLWLGLLFIDRVPALDGDARGWIRVVDALRGVGAERVVPGNGPAPAQWPSAAEAQQRYLERLIQDVEAIIARDGFLEEALETAAASEKDHWLLWDQHHKANVTRVFAKLEWE